MEVLLVEASFLYPKQSIIVLLYHFCMKIVLNSVRAKSLLFKGTKIAAVISGTNQEYTECVREERSLI